MLQHRLSDITEAVLQGLERDDKAGKSKKDASSTSLHPPSPAHCSAQPVMLKTGSCRGYAVLRGEKGPDDELGAMGLL